MHLQVLLLLIHNRTVKNIRDVAPEFLLHYLINNRGIFVREDVVWLLAVMETSTQPSSTSTCLENLRVRVSSTFQVKHNMSNFNFVFDCFANVTQ